MALGKKDVEERGVNSLATVTVSWNVLTETMERRPDVGLDSDDRFFPIKTLFRKAGSEG
jgi:hypothetical protein